MKQPITWTPIDMMKDILPDFILPKTEQGFMTPHCYTCKAKLPEHEVTCKHHVRVQ